jgi:hypothetical protein
MRAVIRPDGSEYIVSSRVTYLAFGWVPPERRAAVVSLLDGLCTEWRAGASPEHAARTLTEPIRSKAIRAASLIRQFEAVVGKNSGPILEQGLRTPERTDCIGIFCPGTYSGEAAADLGDQAAQALADLLLALEAIGVVGANID